MTTTLTTYHVGKWGLEVEEHDSKDPRGLLLVWEPPNDYSSYVIGGDPTMGILGWHRYNRHPDEDKHDNAALEIFRQGRIVEGVKQPDVQVAEWVGPIDAEELAYVANFLGRMYGGSHEDKQALMCLEVYPGPGWLTQRVMHDQYGYDRFPDWLVEGKQMVQHNTGRKGWISNAHTRRDLWIRCGGHVKRRRVVLRSKFFVEEMVACTPDNFLALTARAARVGRAGFNDDRVVAGLISLWFCNEWQLGQEASEPAVLEQTDLPEYQATAVSASEMNELWEARVAELMDGD